MYLPSGVEIPCGRLAAITLLNEKPHQGLLTGNRAPYQDISEANCTTAIGLRASQSPNRVQSRYTGKERDAKSGLDYFGARYYGSNQGRWMSPDWADKPEAVPYSSLDNPQSLNLYGHVLNNPLSKADPDGHAGCPPNCSTGNNVVDFFLGAANAFSSDNLLGAGRTNQTSFGDQLGQRLGDSAALVTGTVEVGLGALGEVGGVALDATGVGAVCGCASKCGFSWGHRTWCNYRRRGRWQSHVLEKDRRLHQRRKERHGLEKCS